MFRVSGDLIAQAHPTNTLTAWPVRLSQDGTLWTLQIGTTTGALLIDMETHHAEELHSAITMLLTFPRMKQVDFGIPDTAHTPTTPKPLDLPLL